MTNIPRHMSPDEFSKLSPEEQDVQTFADRIQQQNVLACQSSLVTSLMQQGEVDGFEIDEVENLYPDPDDWDFDDCKQFLDDHGIDYPEGDSLNPYRMSRDEMTDVLNGISIDVSDGESDDELQMAIIENMNDETLDDMIEAWRSAVRDNADAQEVYEWWLVTDWLAERLDGIGEPLLRNGYGSWWGRTCTGQSMMLDGTLQAVAKQLNDEIREQAKPRVA